MTIDEMFNELENKMRDTYIVTLKYKYDFEENYTIENHILEYESITDSYVWLDDWYEGQTDVEVLGYMLLGDVDTTKLLTCEDCVSREAVITKIEHEDRLSLMGAFCCHDCAMGFKEKIKELPSVKPTYTGEEIQKMQELEQAQLEKAYELGKAESFEEWLASFNTESAPQCFNAVQELKKKLEDKK